jgi:hypothetical protein
MPARLHKVLKVAVGTYEDGRGQKRHEWREIGVEIEHDDGNGNTWTEVKLHADILNPVLFAVVRPLMEAKSGSVWAKKFDVPRRMREEAAEGHEAPEGDGEPERPF